MHYFCTYFDIHYMSRALCLIRSLERYCPSFTLYVLCLDDICLGEITKLDNPHVVPVGIKELEKAVPGLLEIRGTRSQIEYYFTCGPSFIREILSNCPEIDVITYLDADLLFFSSPQPIFDEFEGHSIGIIGTHLPEFRKKPTRHGTYNVGWVTFCRDANGLACLEWWKNRCLEWCRDCYEDGKYADQLYIDLWPKLFNGFYEFTNHGANVAAWNIRDYRFSLREGQVYVDNQALIFFHFHGLKKVAPHIYSTGMELTMRRPSSLIKKNVFLEYIKQLELQEALGFPTGSVRKYRTKYVLLKKAARLFLRVVFGHYVIVFEGRIF